ncbi:Mur ligase family protein [Candidatus Absconditicoccus praedator]|uniref:Mur ligase family protein n=1 Tax=Candidatus Absconditicoccus praedator TaxID=2735562 RepID=UPI001E652D83|nr:Mur ligase family protein [Candidatus Absconditicoccus praedator]UFX82593.1 hypothetical protein HLG78_00370 [Candidatus Absconditicoccus praedator]
MYLIYGKGDVGNGIKNFLGFFDEQYVMLDDNDFHEGKIDKDTKIIPSPGIKPTHTIYQKYQSHICSEMDLVRNILQKNNLKENFRFVGITGSKGKSTTSWILYNILKTHNKNTFIGGNFSPSLSQTVYNILEKGLGNDTNTVVLEVSSFMLYNTQNFEFDYAAFTNIETDHLDRHRDFQDYLSTKQKIFSLTKNKVVIGANIDTGGHENYEICSEKKVFETNLLGEHNQDNINIAFMLAKQIINLPEEKILDSIRNIYPLPNTLELLTTIDNINIYNDGKSTTPNALGSALNSFEEKVVLIAGGADKGADFSQIEQILSQKVAHAFLIGETAEQIGKILEKYWIGYEICDSLEDAIYQGYFQAKNLSKDLVFSPGSSSLDMFSGYKERVDVFKENIKSFISK